MLCDPSLALPTKVALQLRLIHPRDFVFECLAAQAIQILVMPMSLLLILENHNIDSDGDFHYIDSKNIYKHIDFINWFQKIINI